MSTMARDPIPLMSHSTTQGRRFGDQNSSELPLPDPVSCVVPPAAGAGIAVAVGGIAVGIAGCDVGAGIDVAVGGIAVDVTGCDAGVGSDVAVG